jgi:hypothetical protein
MKILYTIMSFALDRHKFLETFKSVYGVNVILTMISKMYVQYFPVADHLICVVPGICGASEHATPFDLYEVPNVLELIFRDRHPSGN